MSAALRDVAFRTGYVAGWRWGVVCGAVGGVLAGSVLVALAIRLGIAWGAAS